MYSFKEREDSCATVFAQLQPVWHLYTQGQGTPLIFKEPGDYRFAMNVIAQAAYEISDVKVIAFEIMGNHLHMLIAGERERMLQFFRFVRKRLSLGLGDSIPNGLPATFSPTLQEVKDLHHIRNLIVYINRNGYVADPNHTPFSYPWGTGRYYFNDYPVLKTLSDVNYTDYRAMFRSRKLSLPEDYLVHDGYVAPPSYCILSQGMSLFRNAHQYFFLLGRKVEALSDIAAEIGDGEFLTDNELFSKLHGIIKKQYDNASLRDLSRAQKLDVARMLHNSFRSSNGQISRVLDLPQYLVNSLFPLSASYADISG